MIKKIRSAADSLCQLKIGQAKSYLDSGWKGAVDVDIGLKDVIWMQISIEFHKLRQYKIPKLSLH